MLRRSDSRWSAGAGATWNLRRPRARPRDWTSADAAGLPILPLQARRVARAMQVYGLIVADNGSDWYVSGTPDRRWDNDQLHTLHELSGRDFEVVDATRR